MILWLALQCAVLPLLLFGAFSPVAMAAATGLAAADLLRCRWRLSTACLRFDGRHWWLVMAGRDDTRLRLERPGYCSPVLLAATLRGAGRTHELLLWRTQVGRETWRRLGVALRYGVSTVSSACGASSG